MNIFLKPTKKEEIDYLQELKDKAYSVNKRYFENEILPGPIDKMDDLYNSNIYQLFTVYLENVIVGAMAVKEIGNKRMQIDSFYIAPEHHGKNIGSTVLKMIEECFPDIKIWRLKTPTQVMKNIVFYVNKCGYSIVKVEEYDRRKENGWYIFEKNK